jgi:hypothetical protein
MPSTLCRVEVCTSCVFVSETTGDACWIGTIVLANAAFHLFD